MIRSYQFRIYPNRAQEFALVGLLDRCRFLYNAALEQRITAWCYRKKSLSFYDQRREVKDIKSVVPGYDDLDTNMLELIVRRIDRTFKAFFRRCKTGEKPGFPRFKGRARFDSIEFRQTGYKYAETKARLRIRGVGHIRVKAWRDLPPEATVKRCILKRRADGWYAIFVCDGVGAQPQPETGREVGLDVGLRNLVTTSDGEVLGDLEPLKRAERRLRRQQRIVSRRKRGSNRRRKAGGILRRRHLDLTRSRKAQLDRISRALIDQNDAIAVEDLNVAALRRSVADGSQSRGMRRNIGLAAWATLTWMLTYKAEDAGRSVVLVDPRGTSQECSRCGDRVPKPLSVRVHRCTSCGLVMDRDHNAAVNILNRGLRLLRGEDGLPTSLKREDRSVGIPAP